MLGNPPVGDQLSAQEKCALLLLIEIAFGTQVACNSVGRLTISAGLVAKKA